MAVHAVITNFVIHAGPSAFDFEIVFGISAVGKCCFLELSRPTVVTQLHTVISNDVVHHVVDSAAAAAAASATDGDG